MIAHLRGTLIAKHPSQAVVEAGGVGYDVAISIPTFSDLPDAGTEVALHIHTHVREDALQLFGFATIAEKQLFEKLISVSGIGPKLAVAVLSGLPTMDLISAIRSGAVETLVRIPGVGKKTAERMVLELKDKLTGIGANAKGAPTLPAADSGFSSLEQDVLSALLNLGCARPAAEESIRKAKKQGAPEDFEVLFRSALALVR